jgi:hypothetical protein
MDLPDIASTPPDRPPSPLGADFRRGRMAEFSTLAALAGNRSGLSSLTAPHCFLNRNSTCSGPRPLDPPMGGGSCSGPHQ